MRFYYPYRPPIEYHMHYISRFSDHIPYFNPSQVLTLTVLSSIIAIDIFHCTIPSALFVLLFLPLLITLLPTRLGIPIEIMPVLYQPTFTPCIQIVSVSRVGLAFFMVQNIPFGDLQTDSFTISKGDKIYIVYPFLISYAASRHSYFKSSQNL